LTARDDLRSAEPPSAEPEGLRSPPLRTELRRAGSTAEFVVATTSALYQRRLVKMGWSPVTGESFTREVADTPDLQRVFANFALHLEDMLLQSAALRPVPWERALEVFLDRVDGSGIRWWLYGSGALALRGIDIEPRDLDLAVDDAHHAAALLSELLVEPATRRRGWVADWTGRAFPGAMIEWLAGVHPTGVSPPHEQEPAADEHLEAVQWRGRTVLVPVLELQLLVAERRGLGDRVHLIRSAMTT
jgi:hypothetical protein